MNVIAKNILNEILGMHSDVIKKDQIVSYINENYGKNDQPIVESNGVTVNPQTVLVTYKGDEYTLPKKEFDLLYYLISNKNKLLTREKILNEVWGCDVFVGQRTIDVHIRRLRTVIPENFIKTSKGVGYRWVEL